MTLRGNKIFGIILIFMGIVLLGRSFNLFYIDIGDIIKSMIPIGLVLLGIWMIARRKRMEQKGDQTSQFYRQQANFGHTDPPEPQPPHTDQRDSSNDGAADLHVNFIDARTAHQEHAYQNPHQDPSGKLKYDKFMGDMYISLDKKNAQNVEVSMFIGDTEMNVSGAYLVEGLNRIIISSFIGDIRIYVPRGTAVFCHNSNFIGDIEAFGRRATGFGNTLDSQTPNYDNAAQKIYVACNSFIGDIKIFEV